VKNGDNQQVIQQRMTTRPVSRLINRLAVPSIIGMLTTAIYNMADTYFVSMISTSASAAVGISLPLATIIQAAGFMFAMGAGSLISRSLGAKNVRKADDAFATALAGVAVLTMLILIFGQLFLTPMLRLFGATDTALPYAQSYARILLFGAPVLGMSFVFNHSLRAQSRNILSMIGLMTGGILNIVLDPVFIFGLDLGIAGAAWATVISQIVSLSVLIWMMHYKSELTFRLSGVSRRMRDYLEIAKIGVASLLRQLLASLAVLIQNNQAAVYGDSALAAIAIVGRMALLVLSIAFGIGLGFQPVAGYNYGAGLYKRVADAWRYAYILMTSIAGVLAVVFFIFSPSLLALFRPDDAAVLEIGTRSLRLHAVGMAVMPFQITTNMLMQSTGRAREAAFLSTTRQGVFFIPLILILPQLFGLLGVQLAQPISDVLASLAAIPLLIGYIRKLRRNQPR